MRHPRWKRGFTLVELLIVIGIIGLLIGLMVPALAAARRHARTTACLSQMRQIGFALMVYVQQSEDYFPRSSHSAIAYRCEPWGRAFMPILGYGRFQAPSGGPRWRPLFDRLYRCPEDDRLGSNTWSYGKSVYFELSSSETGGPTWLKITDVPRPSATALFGEIVTAPGADHLMAHFWPMGGEPEIAFDRHRKVQNYVFADGHVETTRFTETYDPALPLDRWNPITAR